MSHLVSGPPLRTPGADSPDAPDGRHAGLPGFTETLLHAIRVVVAQQHPAAAAESLQRVDALVLRLASGKIHDVTVPGLGRQFSPSYLEGLSPCMPFHDPAEQPWCAALEARAADLCEELGWGGERPRAPVRRRVSLGTAPGGQALLRSLTSSISQEPASTLQPSRIVIVCLCRHSLLVTTPSLAEHGADSCE